MGQIHISLAAETIFEIGGIPITNSLLITWLVSLILIIFAFWFKAESQKRKKGKFFVFVQVLLEGLLKFFEQVAGQKARQFFPLLATFFIFIALANWSGLLPGIGSIGIWKYEHGEKIFIPLFRGPTADLNTTLALAILSVGATQYFGIKNLGFGSYIKKFINLSNPIYFFVGILEIVSEFAKIMSFSFRLFGNIFAGEVLITVMGFLVPFLAPLPFLGLEIFVGAIQALVFSMLSLVFMNVACAKHNNH